MHLNVLRLTVLLSVCLLVQNAAAQECRAKNSINFNINHFNVRLIGYVIKNITVPVAADCARECFSLTKCLSFNMATSISLCQLNSVNSSTTRFPKLVADNNFNYFDLSVIPETAAGPCGKKPCLMHQICISSNGKHTCANVECSPYIAPKNGKVKPTTAAIVEQNVTVSCEAGFKIVGDSLLTCQFDEHWTGVAPTCKRECPPAVAPSNGQVSSPNSYEGETATYTCLDGYSRIGPERATCAQGAWNPSAPLCKQDCSPAVAPSNGQVSAPNSYEGETATYTCDAGYSLIDSETPTCANGAWSPSAPLCKQDCPPAVAPSNGQVSAPNSYEGETATYTCLDGYSLIGSEKATCAKGAWSHSAPLCKQARDCYDVLNFGIGSKGGIYKVYLQNNTPHNVYCDMVTEGGGWTVFQYRHDGSVDFYKTFSEYEKGFGDIHGEFWMGLKYIHEMTDKKKSEIYLQFVDSYGNIAMERFSDFYISAGASYTLHVGALLKQTDTTPNKSLLNNNGKIFSAKNSKTKLRCAYYFHSAWWFNACSYLNPNGQYVTPGRISSYDKGWGGMVNYGWKGYKSLKSTKLMFRRT